MSQQKYEKNRLCEKPKKTSGSQTDWRTNFVKNLLPPPPLQQLHSLHNETCVLFSHRDGIMHSGGDAVVVAVLRSTQQSTNTGGERMGRSGSKDTISNFQEAQEGSTVTQPNPLIRRQSVCQVPGQEEINKSTFLCLWSCQRWCERGNCLWRS